MAQESEADFAVVVVREEGRWEAAALPPRAAESLDALVRALQQQQGEGGAIGLVSVDDDFFVALRVLGSDVRVLLSDASAAEEWDLAGEVLEALGEPMPDESDDDPGPAGDLGLFADLGIDALELESVCDDDELYPDEALGRIATRLGFGELFEDVLDSVPGR